jgi:hypothetical protein
MGVVERERERERERTATTKGEEKEEQEETRERREEKMFSAACGKRREASVAGRVDRGGRELRVVGTAPRRSSNNAAAGDDRRRPGPEQRFRSGRPAAAG